MISLKHWLMDRPGWQAYPKKEAAKPEAEFSLLEALDTYEADRQQMLGIRNSLENDRRVIEEKIKDANVMIDSLAAAIDTIRKTFNDDLLDTNELLFEMRKSSGDESNFTGVTG